MTGVVTIKTSGAAVGSTLKNYTSSGLILSLSLAWDKRKKRKKNTPRPIMIQIFTLCQAQDNRIIKTEVNIIMKSTRF